jgi:hypothetical protein
MLLEMEAETPSSNANQNTKGTAQNQKYLWAKHPVLAKM